MLGSMKNDHSLLMLCQLNRLLVVSLGAIVFAHELVAISAPQGAANVGTAGYLLPEKCSTQQPIESLLIPWLLSITSESKNSGELRYPLLAEYVVDRYNNKSDVLPDTQLALERGVMGSSHWALNGTAAECFSHYLAALRAQTAVAAAVTSGGVDAAIAATTTGARLPLISLSPDAQPSCAPYTVQLRPDTHAVQLMVGVLGKAVEHVRQRAPQAAHVSSAQRRSTLAQAARDSLRKHADSLRSDQPQGGGAAASTQFASDSNRVTVAVLRSDLLPQQADQPANPQAQDDNPARQGSAGASLQQRFVDAVNVSMPAGVAVVSVPSWACVGSDACAYSTWGNATADVDAVRAAGAAVLVLALTPSPLLALLAVLALHGRDLLASGLVILSLTSAPATALRWLDGWRGERSGGRDYELTMPPPLRNLAASCSKRDSGTCLLLDLSPSTAKLAYQGMLYPSIRFWNPSVQEGEASQWAWNFTRTAPTAATDFMHVRCSEACEDIATAALPIDVLAHAAHAAAAAGYGCYLGDADWGARVLVHMLAQIRVPSAFGQLSFAARTNHGVCPGPAGLAVVDFSGVRNVRFQTRATSSGSRFPRADEQLAEVEELLHDVKYNQDPEVAFWRNGSLVWDRWDVDPGAAPRADPRPAFILWSDGAVSQLT